MEFDGGITHKIIQRLRTDMSMSGAFQHSRNCLLIDNYYLWPISTTQAFQSSASDFKYGTSVLASRNVYRL